MAAAVADDIDSLVGSLQSVHAGDRGHAIQDLRDSLIATLGHVALGPASTGQEPPSAPAPGVPYPSPPPGLAACAPPSTMPDESVFLSSPPASQGRATPVHRSRAGSHGARHPPSSPARCGMRGNKHGRLRAEPYSASRPRASGSSSAHSRNETRHTTPELVSAVLAELHPTSTSHSRAGSRHRSRSASNVSTTSAPAQGLTTPSPASDLPLGPGTTSSPGPGNAIRKPSAPTWGHAFAFTPMHQEKKLAPPPGSMTDGTPVSSITAPSTLSLHHFQAFDSSPSPVPGLESYPEYWGQPSVSSP